MSEYGIAPPGWCAECQRDVPTVDEWYRCQDCAAKAEAERLGTEAEAESSVSVCLMALEIAAVNFGMDMGQESLMRLLRAHHSLARAQGYVLVTPCLGQPPAPDLPIPALRTVVLGAIRECWGDEETLRRVEGQVLGAFDSVTP